MKKPKPFISLLLIGMLFMLTCKLQEKPVEITFGFNTNESESIQPLIDEFNQNNQGKIKVNWEETSVISDEFYHELEEDFEAKKARLDVFGADVVWTATFASRNWVENLSPQFYNEYNPSDFVEPALSSAIYNFKVWGVPWFTDTGIIFMRKDLLEKANFDSAPETWAELKAISKTVMADSKVKYGYVFQGAVYEGGVANACEFIWSKNGKIILSDLYVPEGQAGKNIPLDIITVDSKEVEEGLTLARSLIKEGISPVAVADFREQEAIRAFQNGDAVFLRGWPGNFSAFSKKESVIKPEQVSVCRLPAVEKGKPSFSCLGGWNLMINAQSEASKKEAAWTFIKFMTDKKQQRFRAMAGGILPSLNALYEDKDLLETVPVIALAKESIQHARSRPISPIYMKLAPKISNIFNQVLKGEIEPEYAVSVLQMELDGVEEEAISLNK